MTAMTELRVSPAEVDLTIHRGDDVELALRLSITAADGTTTYPDISGWTGASHIRRDADSTTLLGAFTVITSSAVVDSENGYFNMELDAATSELLPADAVWDLEFTNDESKKRTYMGGKIRVTADVTRVEGS